MKIIKFLLNDFKGFIILTLLMYGIAFTYFYYDEKRQEAFFNDMSPIVKNVPTYPGAKLFAFDPQANKKFYSVAIDHNNIRFNDYNFRKHTKSMSQFINGEHREILKFYDEYLTKAGLVFSDSIAMIENPYIWNSPNTRNQLNYINTKEGFVWRYSDPKNKDYVICVSPDIGYGSRLSPKDDGDRYIPRTVITFYRSFKNSCPYF